MSKYLLLLVGLTFLSVHSYAHRYAVAPCTGQTQNELIQQLLNTDVELLSITNERGYVIVEAEESEVQSFCFYSLVRILDHHLCYNTDRLMVKFSNPDEDFIQSEKLVPHAIIPDLYYTTLEVKNDEELTAYRSILMENVNVKYVGYDQVFTMDLSVNDPLYTRQWAIENTGSPLQYNGTPGADMSVDSAWTITTGDPNIKIAVLDSGVDTLHEDMLNNLLAGFDGFADSVNDTQGYPTPNYNSDGHGTCCAGIIAAEGDNNLGIAGIAYGSKIIPVRIFYYFDYGAPVGIQATTTTDAMLSGAAYAWRTANCDIMSTSAGLPPIFITALGIDTALINLELTDAWNEARNFKGLAMFFSSGNDDISGVLWPANHPKTIAVGASSMCDERKSSVSCDGEGWGSNFGESLDVIAPGVKICATDMTGSNGYTSNSYFFIFNGTSAACPNAAGVGALVLSVNPNLTGEQVRTVINQTADRVPGYTYDSINPSYWSWNNAVGYGRVNAYQAVKAAQQITGFDEITNGEFIVYPNPTSDFIAINPQAYTGNWSIEIVDLNGKILLSRSFHGSYIQKVELKSSNGIYLMSLKSDNGSFVYRIIKQ